MKKASRTVLGLQLTSYPLSLCTISCWWRRAKLSLSLLSSLLALARCGCCCCDWDCSWWCESSRFSLVIGGARVNNSRAKASAAQCWNKMQKSHQCMHLAWQRCERENSPGIFLQGKNGLTIHSQEQQLDDDRDTCLVQQTAWIGYSPFLSFLPLFEVNVSSQRLKKYSKISVSSIWAAVWNGEMAHDSLYPRVHCPRNCQWS